MVYRGPKAANIRHTISLQTVTWFLSLVMFGLLINICKMMFKIIFACNTKFAISLNDQAYDFLEPVFCHDLFQNTHILFVYIHI